MSRKPSEATKAWEVAVSKGEMAWLRDTTFVAADCFMPPSNYQPHTWERIAVPPAILSHRSGLVYKRVPGRSVDTKYNMVVAELKSQGVGGRKRARTTNYKSVYGPATFDPKYEHDSANFKYMKRRVAVARLQVKTAYERIAQANQALRKNARPTKRPSYDPTQLVSVPRKRRNTRLPITPPTWEKMLAECQPLIAFETKPAEPDKAAKAAKKANFFEQVAAAHRRRARVRQKRPCKSRRAKFVPTKLDTISEEFKEPSGVPVKYQPMYKAPKQRWAAAADKYFTMSATAAGVVADDGEGDDARVVITNTRGHFQCPPSASSGSSTATPSEPGAEEPVVITNTRGHFQCPPSASSGSSTATPSEPGAEEPVVITNTRGHFQCPPPASSGSSTTTSGDRKRRAEDDDLDQRTPARRRLSHPDPAADPAAVAVFNQPTQVHAEPEHETKRRVSLDNARRSDRSHQMTSFKKVRTWVATTFSGRRRSYSEAMEGEQDGQDEPPRTRLRRTLDLDAGSNPDIFGQTPSHNPRRKIKSAMLRYGQHTSTAKWESISDVPSEFSAVQRTLYPEPATEPDTTPVAPAPLPMCNVAFKDYDGIPNICDSIRNHLDRRANMAFGKIDDVDEIEKATKRVVEAAIKEAKEAKQAKEAKEANEVDEGAKADEDDKIDDGDSIASDDTQPFDEDDRAYDRIKGHGQPGEDEKSTTGDVEVDTTVPNSPATEPRMADSPVTNSPSHDLTVPDSPKSGPPSAMETTVETARMSPDPDTPLQSVEDDVVETTSVETTTVESTVAPTTVESATVESTIVESAVIDTLNPEEPAASPQPAGHSDGDSHAATGQHLDAATPDRMTLDEAAVEQPSVIPQPVEAAEVEPNEDLVPEATAQPQVVDAQVADSGEDSQLDVLHNFLRRAQMKVKAVWSGSTTATPSAAEPQNAPKSPSEPKTPIVSVAAPESPRKALTQKDSNMSPIAGKTSMSGSPGKKRKLNDAEGQQMNLTKGSGLVKPDLEDTIPQPTRKRRRRGAEDDASDEVLNPEMMAHTGSLTQKGSFGGPRRSKRVAPPRTTVVYTGSSNFPASLIGSLDADLPAVSTAGLMQQRRERDLATLTRTNTRRNKGAAIPPPARLAAPSFANDPFVSPEKASGSQAARPRRSVRWAETLARYQGDDAGESSSSTMAASAAAAAADADAADADAAAAQPALEQPPSPTGQAPPAASPFAPSSSAAPESEKKKALRPRPSRLPAAVAKTPAPAPTPAPTTTTTTPRSRAAAASTPSRAVPSTPSRRSSAVGARLGTSAAKRRGSAKK
ncbi:hypothetical protein KVR01_005953 [Diaporthe batatas]|uniref:uncharacterized protein n=1 Tax=Diaporthe batatas TaxID=748121 RepID=UPI001D041531|nr:uncharacterized protein KVR01_005953 [Diaporthe batatas]KAG8164035.1 hypothetical protein KVR01_005953 [Diaporthe batatas]